MWNNIFVISVLHTEALWDNTELRKAKPLIQVQSMDIGGNDGIELKYAETKTGTCFQRMLHQLFPNMQSPLTFFNSIAGVADMTATAYIVWMENIETYNLIRLTVYGNASIRLAHEESVCRLIRQLFILRKSNTFADNGIPYRHCLLLVFFFVSSYLNHNNSLNA